MVTAFNILYSAAAVRRLLGLGARVEVQIREFAWVIWVWVKGRRPTFIGKARFRQHFVDWRRRQGAALVVTQDLDSFGVVNPGKETVYRVEARRDGVFCTCDDFNNQLEFFGRGCCKHGYAVLGFLGLSSLADYLGVQKVVPFPRTGEAVAVYAA
ncbi:MAG: hypothetical protein ACKO63_18465 [Nodosilinea sp.]